MSTSIKEPASTENEQFFGKPKRWWQRTGGTVLVVSILIHVIFGIIAGYFVVQHFYTKPKPIPPPAGPSRSAETVKVQMEVRDQTMSAPAVKKKVTTDSPLAKVALPEMPDVPTDNVMPTAMAGVSANFGTGTGMGTGSDGGGVGSGFKMFNVQVTGKRIALLVDYSGTMIGDSRESLEKDLEKSLKGFPPDTQLLVIPWAGGVWRYDEIATDISNKWQGGGDDFALRPGEKVPVPQWIKVSGNVGNIMKKVRAQVNWTGGTDWRWPFRSAALANPPPDTIFFMTDGEIGAHPDRAFAAIDESLRGLPKMPKIVALWIQNPNHDRKPMQDLAAKYHGQFKEVSQARR